MAYSGISVGWRWNAGTTYAADNLIEGNNIHNVMQVLNDGGCVYMVGRQTGSEVRNNFCYDVVETAQHTHRKHLYGYYLDQGSKDIAINDNVVYNIASAPLLLHRSFDNLVKRNTIVNGEDYMLSWLGTNRPDSVLGVLPSGNVFTNNIVYYESDGEIFVDSSFPSIETSDLNLYYHPNYTTNLNWDLPEWQQLGFDSQPIVLDPMFASPSVFDFRPLLKGPLCNGSLPGSTLGFPWAGALPCVSPPEISGTWISSGNLLFVFGSGFDSAADVLIDGQTASNKQFINQTLFIILLQPNERTGTVTVSTTDGSTSAPFGQLLSGVNVTGMWPSSAKPNDFIFLFGSGLGNVTSVDVNGQFTFLVEAADDTLAIFMVPNGATTGPVTAHTPEGSATAPVPLTVNN